MAEPHQFQLLAPGMPELSGPWNGDYEIVWSIYIRCTSRRELRQVHIPALEKIIGQPHGGRGWVIEREKQNPDELRLMTLERIGGPYRDDMLIAFLTKLYALNDVWRITANLETKHTHGIYVCAICTDADKGGMTPAVTTAMVELQADFDSLFDDEQVRLTGNGNPFSL